VSRENLNALQRVYRAWAEGDVRGDTSIYDPHIVYLSQPGDPDRGPHLGLGATGEYYRDFLASWDDWRIEADEYREVGDSIVVRARRTGIGKGSRVPVEDEVFHVWSFRGGKVIRMEVFRNEAEALEAVGLTE
jgi:ketosteroid isomerase-like protein